MNKPENITREIVHKNGVVEIWVESKPSNRMHSATYPRIWGYIYNGIKYTSKKQAYIAATK